MDLMLQPLRRYRQFTGRADRAEYWLFVLFSIVVGLVVGAIGAVVFRGGLVGQTLQFLAALYLFVPSLAVGARRLHDTDRSAWWLLLPFIPLIGFVVLLVFMVLPGTTGSNRFGSDPKSGGLEIDLTGT